MQIEKLSLEAIVLTRDTRQRRDLGNLKELRASIGKYGLFHPIIVDQDNHLVAGERRLTAVKMMGWKEIAVQRLELLPIDKQIVELQENVARLDLTWQERTLTIHKILELDTEQGIYLEQTADKLNLKPRYLSKLAAVGEALLLQNCPGLTEVGGISMAIQKVAANKERRTEKLLEQARISITPEKAPSHKASPKIDLQLAEKPPEEVTLTAEIRCDDARDFMSTYVGERFNLIHLDTPYGQDLQDSNFFSQQGTVGLYQDSPEVMRELLQSFHTNFDKIVAASAHIFYWFQFDYYGMLMKFFTKHLPQIQWYSKPLIWHKGDRGFMPDATRYPAHGYETCLFGIVGDRKLVRSRYNVYSAPKGPNATNLHPSQKNGKMLKHFLSMCVTPETRLFDPTCGSGMAVKVADDLGASYSLGLELDPVTAHHAQTFLTEGIY